MLSPLGLASPQEKTSTKPVDGQPERPENQLEGAVTHSTGDAFVFVSRGRNRLRSC